MLKQISHVLVQGSCKGRTGYFPASYVQTVSIGNQIVQAMFDFTAEGPGELPLAEGQVSVRPHEKFSFCL